MTQLDTGECTHEIYGQHHSTHHPTDLSTAELSESEHQHDKLLVLEQWRTVYSPAKRKRFQDAQRALDKCMPLDSDTLTPATTSTTPTTFSDGNSIEATARASTSLDKPSTVRAYGVNDAHAWPRNATSLSSLTSQHNQSPQQHPSPRRLGITIGTNTSFLVSKSGHTMAVGPTDRKPSTVRACKHRYRAPVVLYCAKMVLHVPMKTVFERF